MNFQKPKLQRVGIAADHGRFELKEQLIENLRVSGHEVVDFGDNRRDTDDDFRDFVAPLTHAVARGEVDRGIAIYGSGVGTSDAANKVAGVRAGLIHEGFSAHQGVEDDDLNMFCLGGRVVGHALAWELVQSLQSMRSVMPFARTGQSTRSPARCFSASTRTHLPRRRM